MQKILERNQHKTSDGEFIFELLNEYELSPKESSSILESAKRCLIRDNVLKEGEIEVSVIFIEERSGRMTESMKKIRVRLTTNNGLEDSEVLKESGRVSLRRIIIQRITSEAIEQNGILSQEDISKYLRCSVRTVKRDISFIKESGIEVITRGVLHNIGRGQTHKVKIIGLYLEGKTFSEIRLKTHHSGGAIKRYLQDFQKVLMSIYHGIKEASSISKVTGLSINLIRQYIELISQSRKDVHRKAMMDDMIRQWKRAGTRIKKKEDISSDYMRNLAPMIGGVK
jgi:DNA-binding Lrp family transcriptional regulator